MTGVFLIPVYRFRFLLGFFPPNFWFFPQIERVVPHLKGPMSEQIHCVETLNHLLPVLIAGTMPDDGSKARLLAEAQRTRTRARFR